MLNDRGDGTSPALFRVTNPVAGPRTRSRTAWSACPTSCATRASTTSPSPSIPPTPTAWRWPAATWRSGRPRRTAHARRCERLRRAIVVADVAPDPGNAGVLTYGQPTPYTMIGIGVHADVHALVYSNGGARSGPAATAASSAPTRPRGRPASMPATTGCRSASRTTSPATRAAKARRRRAAGQRRDRRACRAACGSCGTWATAAAWCSMPPTPTSVMAQYVQGSWNPSTPRAAPAHWSAPGTLAAAEDDARARSTPRRRHRPRRGPRRRRPQPTSARPWSAPPASGTPTTSAPRG